MQNGQVHSPLRLPLFLRLALFILLLFTLSVGSVLSFTMVKQAEFLAAESLNSGERFLRYCAATAKIPLLADDILQLNSIVKNAAGMDGIAYSYIVGPDRKVVADTRLENLGREFVPQKGEIIVSKKDSTTVLLFQDNSGEQIFDLASPVVYDDKTLGVLHLGMYRKYIDDHKQSFAGAVAAAASAPAVAVLLLFLCFAGFYARRTKAEVAELVDAINQYTAGNLEYEIRPAGNSEIRDIGQALTHMAQKLADCRRNTSRLEQYLQFSPLDRIFEGPTSKGESYAVRRPVAILFAGVKGFGSYASSEKPEEVVLSLNKYIGIATTIISKHGGYVDKIIGDAVVGIFGVSLYRENHPVRALQAALDLQQALCSGGGEDSQLLSNVCVGVSSGIVLSGNIGSHSKVEYSSVGESIKEAWQLSGLGNPGEIILGEGIYDQMKDSITVTTLPPQKVIGSSEAMQSYRFVKMNNHRDEN